MANRSKEYQVGEKYEWKGGLYRNERRMDRGRGFGLIPELTLLSVLRRVYQGVAQLIIAVKYYASRIEGGRWQWRWPRLNLPWWKLGLAALAVFILLKKDIQFSINMRAPAGGAPRDEESVRTGPDVEELNLAQPMSLGGKKMNGIASADALADEQVRAYTDRFAEVAVAEMRRFGIPASVKMGQALMESWAGQSPEARRRNNHFGPRLAGQAYRNAWENWREHSLLLYHEYGNLFENGRSYKKWARGLRQAGYSRDRRYDRKLVDVIEKYQLYLLDEPGDN